MHLNQMKDSTKNVGHYNNKQITRHDSYHRPSYSGSNSIHASQSVQKLGLPQARVFCNLHHQVSFFIEFFDPLTRLYQPNLVTS